MFGQCLSPGDSGTLLSSILGAAEGWRVKFKKSLEEKLSHRAAFTSVAALLYTGCPDLHELSSVFLLLIIRIILKNIY